MGADQSSAGDRVWMLQWDARFYSKLALLEQISVSSTSFDSQAWVQLGELKRKGGSRGLTLLSAVRRVVILITAKVECPVDGVSLAVAGLARFWVPHWCNR